MKKLTAESASAFLSCPYCGKRRFKSRHGLNYHIGQAHDGNPRVSVVAVLSLALGEDRARKLASVLRPFIP